MGVEICFKHIEGMSFSYTSFDNFTTCLLKYLNEEQQDIINCLSWKDNKEVCEYEGPHGTFNAVCGTINDLINTLKYIGDRMPTDHGFYRDLNTFIKRASYESKCVSPEIWINC